MGKEFDTVGFLRKKTNDDVCSIEQINLRKEC